MKKSGSKWLIGHLYVHAMPKLVYTLEMQAENLRIFNAIIW